MAGRFSDIIIKLLLQYFLSPPDICFKNTAGRIIKGRKCIKTFPCSKKVITRFELKINLNIGFTFRKLLLSP
ncbi:MAG TPA: hypothetical protein DHO02_01670 [Syntrophaceae bacterium]|nr:hypothetical protein [Syntrophaceae bacterium]